MALDWDAAPTAAPLVDLRAVQGLRRGVPYDHMIMSLPAYRRIHWAATLGSVRHLPKRTRLRLLARIRKNGGFASYEHAKP